MVPALDVLLDHTKADSKAATAGTLPLPWLVAAADTVPPATVAAVGRIQGQQSHCPWKQRPIIAATANSTLHATNMSLV